MTDKSTGIGTFSMTLAWACAWLVTAALIAATEYSSRDSDSQLYAALSSRMSQEPVERWIAPDWWGFWGVVGPYCEHPVGMFVIPAALARGGYPAGQAAYAVNALYQVFVFCLATMIAGTVIRGREARALGWILQLLPIAFVFRIRANQEYAVLAGLLFAVYATERARTVSLWTLGMMAGFCAVLLVKGVFALTVPLTCALWLVARRSHGVLNRQGWPPWMAIALMPIVGVVVTGAYEAAYTNVTGRSFLAIYTSRQLPSSALIAESPVVRIAYTAVWYAGRIIWYAFPWSLPALAAVIRGSISGHWWPRQVNTGGPAGDGLETAHQGAWFALVTSIVLTAGFTLAHRKADRYIFPVYFLIGAAGAVGAIHRFPRLAQVVERFDRPWVPAAVYVGLVLAGLLSSGNLPQFTFWRT